MPTPRLNWGLFLLYGFSVISVFVAALLLPQVRQRAYAPLRELLLPPPAPITLSILYSTEKEAWLNQMAAQFENSGARVEGHPIHLEQLMAQIGSGQEGGNSIKLFTIAFGSDADEKILRQIAEATGGKQYKGDPATIRTIYAEIATFF